MRRIAVVSGGAQGIGFAICKRLAAEANTSVALLDCNEEAGNAATRELRQSGYDVNFYRCDVTSAAGISQCLAEVCRELARPSVLVNNAGIIRDNWIEKITEADWDAVLDTNLKGAFLMCKAVVPLMREAGGGRVVNISSRTWLGSPGQTNYSASKGGLVSFSRSLALETARFSINVNVVAPGLIDTPLVRSLPQDVQQQLIQAQPTKHMGKPEDVAAAVSFLASADAAFITGQVLHVCGGKSVGIGI